MNEATWNDSMVTGDALVDRQHQDIHSLVQHVRDVDDRPEEVMSAIERLMDHVDCHFMTEEELMRRAGYPEDLAGTHMDEHRRLTESARAVVLGFRTGQLSSTHQLAAFLTEWLSGHIERCDRMFIAFVREVGLSAELPERWAPRPALGEEIA